MNRRTLLGGLATLPLLGGNNNNNDSDGDSDGRELNLSLNLQNDETTSTSELKAQNPTTLDATIKSRIDTTDYPYGRLSDLHLEPGETQTTGIGTSPPRDYPNQVKLTLIVEWD